MFLTINQLLEKNPPSPLITLSPHPKHKRFDSDKK